MLSLSRDSSALPEKAVGDTQAIFLRHYLFSTPKNLLITSVCVCVAMILETSSDFSKAYVRVDQAVQTYSALSSTRQ